MYDRGWYDGSALASYRAIAMLRMHSVLREVCRLPSLLSCKHGHGIITSLLPPVP